MLITSNEIILGLCYDKQLSWWSHLYLLGFCPFLIGSVFIFCRHFSAYKGKKANLEQRDRKSCKPVIMESSKKLAVDNKYG